VRGGHLIEGKVWPTLEVVITEAPGVLRRVFDEETQLPLLDLRAA
jgi:predicted DNA-binding protein with PD1-like motif